MHLQKKGLSDLLPSPIRPRSRYPRNALDWAWLCFLIWTAVGFVVMPLGISARQAHGWLDPYHAGGFAAGFLRVSDAIWMLLAAVTVYLHAVASEGLPTARRQAAIILVAATVFEWIGTRTGFPFGPYEYTENFGPRIGGVVPMAIPLAWLVVVLCGRQLVLSLRPQANRLEIALGVALTAVLTDLNLEGIAWHVRDYWRWYPAQADHPPSDWPPPQNYVAWFVISLALALALPSDHTLRIRRPSRWRPILVLLLMNTLLALVHLTAGWRNPPRTASEEAQGPFEARPFCKFASGSGNVGKVSVLSESQNLFEYSDCLRKRTLPSVNR